MESLNKNYIKSVLGRLSGLDLLSGSVSECMCKLYGIDTLLPDCEVELPGCHGLHRKHGLYLQCCDELYEGDLCKKCTTKASNSSYGKPPHGLIEERRGKGPSYIAPDGGKAVSFANVVEELGINLEDAKYYAESLGWVIPKSELVYKEKKRGRPKKEKEENNEPAKKRGRPKKEEIIQSQDDMIAEMASQLEMEYSSNNSSNEDKKAEKERIKAEKELDKANKKAEKERIKVEKKLEKANKKAEKERIKAEKELEKANKKAEKERIKVEKKLEKANKRSEKDLEKEENNEELKTKSMNQEQEHQEEHQRAPQHSKQEEVDEEELKLNDGDKIELDTDFYGVVTRIEGEQYIITNGYPGDDEDDEKIVWFRSSIGEVESIGEYVGERIVLFKM